MLDFVFSTLHKTHTHAHTCTHTHTYMYVCTYKAILHHVVPRFSVLKCWAIEFCITYSVSEYSVSDYSVSEYSVSDYSVSEYGVSEYIVSEYSDFKVQQFQSQSQMARSVRINFKRGDVEFDLDITSGPIPTDLLCRMFLVGWTARMHGCMCMT